MCLLFDDKFESFWGERGLIFKKYLNKQYTGRVKEKTLESIKTD